MVVEMDELKTVEEGQVRLYEAGTARLTCSRSRCALFALHAIYGWRFLLTGCIPIEQANDLPQFHFCDSRRHHPVSFCSEEFQKLLPADAGCELSSALAPAMRVDDANFLLVTRFCLTLALALGDDDKSGLRSACSCSASALRLGDDDESGLSSTSSCSASALAPGVGNGAFRSLTCPCTASALAAGVDNEPVMGSTYVLEITGVSSSNLVSSGLERSPANVLSRGFEGNFSCCSSFSR